MVERSFAHVLDRGGMRREWVRGRDNLHKRYLIHVAGSDLGILMRALFGCGTPRETANAAQAVLFVIRTDNTLLFAFAGREGGEQVRCSSPYHATLPETRSSKARLRQRTVKR